MLLGITEGDHDVIVADDIVAKDLLPRCTVTGNPAKIIRAGIMTTNFGCLTDTPADDATEPSRTI